MKKKIKYKLIKSELREGDITMDNSEIQRIIINYYKNYTTLNGIK